MDALTKKLLASLVAIAMIASALTGFVTSETTADQSPTCPFNEDFSGSWLPSGWETDDWDQSDSSYAEGTSPEARLEYGDISGDYAYLDSKPVDTTGMSSLTLEFKSFIDDYRGDYDCRVYIRANGSDSWTDVTPWSNPIYGNVGPYTYLVDISSHIGSATQVRFEFDGYYDDLDYWYVDDVRICYVTPPPALTCPFDEDFSGSFPPSGWETDDWDQSDSSNAGGTSPEARLDYEDISGDYAYLDSKPVDTTGMSSLTLEFKSFIDDYEGDYDCRVYIRANGGDAWTDVTPWSNPIYGNVGPYTYWVDISSHIGSATQVRFEFDGYYDWIDDWYVDDVKICYPTPAAPIVGVGGEAYPVNKISLLVPWIAVAVLLAGGISWYALRRRKAQS